MQVTQNHKYTRGTSRAGLRCFTPSLGTRKAPLCSEGLVWVTDEKPPGLPLVTGVQLQIQTCQTAWAIWVHYLFTQVKTAKRSVLSSQCEEQKVVTFTFYFNRKCCHIKAQIWSHCDVNAVFSREETLSHTLYCFECVKWWVVLTGRNLWTCEHVSFGCN